MSADVITKIVTHPGSAHKDEFLAICLAAHKTGCTTIERRVATEADLDDPSVMVIDQGKRYEPERNNFDHHHDAGLQSSYPLLAKHLGVDAALQVYDKAYERLDIDDRTGPVKAASNFNLSVGQYVALQDPISNGMLDLFSQYTVVPPEFAGIMRELGKNLVTRAQEYQPDYARLAATIEIKEVDGVKYFVDAQDKSVAREDFARENGVAVIVSPNTRDGGWKLKRMDDHPRVDFRNAKNLDDFDAEKAPKSFIHANGFFAATTNQNANIEAIVQASLVQVMPEQPGFADKLAGHHERRRAAGSIDF